MSETNGTTFKDAAGREWRLRITVGLLGVVRRELGVELGKILADQEKLAEWGRWVEDDPERFVGVLYLACREQADAAGVTPEQFGGSIDGPAYQASVAALMGAVADFTRPPQTAGAMKTAIRELVEKTDAAQASRVAAILNDPATLSGLVGNLPASADWTHVI